jgi:hypothetical protein
MKSDLCHLIGDLELLSFLLLGLPLCLLLLESKQLLLKL